MAKNFARIKFKIRVLRFVLIFGYALGSFWGALLVLCPTVFAGDNTPKFTTIAQQALLFDKQTDSILFEKQADMRIPPASLAKLMAVEVIFNALKTNKISLNDEYVISENAWRNGGAPSRTTTMFAAVKSKVSVDNLLQGLIVLQANDAAIALAEGSFNNEKAFVAQMNVRAQQIGLNSSHFVNPTGLPQEGQYTTLRDLVKLAAFIDKEYPDYIGFYSQPSFKWNKIFQYNRNPLLTANLGVYGFVNGFSEGQGYSIILTVKNNEKQFFLAIAGVAREKERNEEVKRVINWVVNEFSSYLIFAKDENIAQAALFGGVNDHIALKVNQNLAVAVLKKQKNKLEAKVTYDGPLTAPMPANVQVGTVKILYDGEMIIERPVFTAQETIAADVVQRAKNAFYELTFGWIRNYWH